MTVLIEKFKNDIRDPDSKFFKIVRSTGIGYLSCRFLHIINPNVAALFNATTELTKIFVNKKFQESRLDMIKGLIISGSCIAIGSFATNFVAPLSSIDALKLTALTMISDVALKVFWH